MADEKGNNQYTPGKVISLPQFFFRIQLMEIWKQATKEASKQISNQASK